jgi:exosome complex component RRP41
MAYVKRFDGRKFDETRPIVAKVGVIPRADGSAMFQIGNTTAYAAVYGPRNLHPKFMQDPKTGILRCEYNMLPFSGHGERVRPGGGRRAREIGMVTESALRPVLDLKEYPNAVVDVYIDLPQTDAGTRCAGITAAAMALADAGIEMKELVAAVAIGNVQGSIVADLTYAEEQNKTSTEGVADTPVAFLPLSGKVTLLQMDGPTTREQLKKALHLGRDVCKKIVEIQKQALRAKYTGESQ